MAAAGSHDLDKVPDSVLRCILDDRVVQSAKAISSTILLEGKVIVVGSMNAGKTSLILRLIRDEFSSATAPSLGVAYHQHSITCPGCELQASIWDTAGQERFRALSGMYVRGAAAAIFVYDVSHKQSLSDLAGWRDMVARHAAKGAILAVAANKTDLPQSKWQVSREEGVDFARKVGARVFAETSAASGRGVRSLFQALALVGRHQADQTSSSSSSADDEDCGFKLTGVEKGGSRKKLQVYGGDGAGLDGDESLGTSCGC